LEASLGNKSEILFQKKTTQTRVGGVTQVVECLPSKSEALSSNPSTSKKLMNK
jgi:hypothetical protein